MPSLLDYHKTGPHFELHFNTNKKSNAKLNFTPHGLQNLIVASNFTLPKLLRIIIICNGVIKSSFSTQLKIKLDLK